MKAADPFLEPDPIRVALVDPQQLVRDGIRSILSRSSDMTVVGEASGRADALALAEREQPDVILMDLSVLDPDLSLISEITKLARRSRILLLTGFDDGELGRRAVLLGVRGLVSKDVSADALTRAVQRVCAGEVWLDQSAAVVVFQELSRHNARLSPEEIKMSALTDREKEVIRAVGEGLKNKQIGARLFISDVTVRHHLTSIFNKLGVSDRLALVIYAYRNGLAPVPR